MGVDIGEALMQVAAVIQEQYSPDDNREALLYAVRRMYLR